MKFEEALYRFRAELIKEYGIDAPIAEIRLKRDAYQLVITDIVIRQSTHIHSVTDLAELKVFGVTVLPEKR